MTAKPQRYAIVGMPFREKEGIPANAILKEVPPDEPCVLVRDPENRYDRNAVQVWVRDQHVGFIPKTQNAVLAKFIDENGKHWTQPVTAGPGAISDSSVTLRKAVDGRVHKGNNTHPLVEIV